MCIHDTYSRLLAIGYIVSELGRTLSPVYIQNNSPVQTTVHTTHLHLKILMHQSHQFSTYMYNTPAHYMQNTSLAHTTHQSSSTHLSSITVYTSHHQSSIYSLYLHHTHGCMHAYCDSVMDYPQSAHMVQRI